MSVEENIAFPLSRHSNMATQEQEKKVRELLGEVGMDQDRAKWPSQISGGMQKRVGLARALPAFPVSAHTVNE